MKKGLKVFIAVLAIGGIVGTGVGLAVHYHNAGEFQYPWDNAALIGQIGGYDKIDWAKQDFDRNYVVDSKNDTLKTVTLDYSDDTSKLCKAPATVTISGTAYTATSIKGVSQNQYIHALYLPDGFMCDLSEDTWEDTKEIGSSAIEYISVGTGVSAIREGFAFGFRNLSKVDFRGDEITSVGANSFYGCASLTSFDFPKTLTNIGNDAFAYSGLKEINLPASLETLNLGAFRYCSQLKKVALPEELKTISNSAFRGDANLTEITIPESVTLINNYAFAYCGVKSLEIPEQINAIAPNMFYSVVEGSQAIIDGAKPVVGANAFKAETAVYFKAYKADVTWATLATERTKTDKKVYYKGEWKLVNGQPVLTGEDAAVATASSAAATSSSAA